MLSTTDHLVALADAFQEAAKVGDSTLSWRVFGDSKKLKAIRDGADLHSRRLAKSLAWFSDNWPSGVPWPAGVPRPSIGGAP